MTMRERERKTEAGGNGQLPVNQTRVILNLLHILAKGNFCVLFPEVYTEYLGYCVNGRKVT